MSNLFPVGTQLFMISVEISTLLVNNYIFRIAESVRRIERLTCIAKLYMVELLYLQLLL